jgi:hypothetical protein
MIIILATLANIRPKMRVFHENQSYDPFLNKQTAFLAETLDLLEFPQIFRRIFVYCKNR